MRSERLRSGVRKSTGFLTATNTSIVVRSPVWVQSTTIPTRSIPVTSNRPNLRNLAHAKHQPGSLLLIALAT